MIESPHYLPSDDFGKVARAMMDNESIWVATVRNEDTLALYDVMMRLLQDNFVEDIIDPFLLPNGDFPAYMREIDARIAAMTAPLDEMVQGEVIDFMGQHAHTDEHPIGRYHTDRVPWVAMLSTDITGEALIQKTLPVREDYRVQFNRDDVLARDPDTLTVTVEPGSALVLRSLAPHYMTPFHPVPRCPPGKSRLCVARHP